MLIQLPICYACSCYCLRFPSGCGAFQEVIISVQGAFGVLDGGSTLTPEAFPGGGAYDDATLQWQAEQRRLEETMEKIKEYVDTNDLGNKISVWLDERGLMICFLDTTCLILDKLILSRKRG